MMDPFADPVPPYTEQAGQPETQSEPKPSRGAENSDDFQKCPECKESWDSHRFQERVSTKTSIIAIPAPLSISMHKVTDDETGRRLGRDGLPHVRPAGLPAELPRSRTPFPPAERRSTAAPRCRQHGRSSRRERAFEWQAPTREKESWLEVEPLEDTQLAHFVPATKARF